MVMARGCEAGMLEEDVSSDLFACTGQQDHHLHTVSASHSPMGWHHAVCGRTGECVYVDVGEHSRVPWTLYQMVSF